MKTSELSVFDLVRRYLLPLTQFLDILGKHASLRDPNARRPMPESVLQHNVYDPLHLLFDSMLRSSGASLEARKAQHVVLVGLLTALSDACKGLSNRAQMQNELSKSLSSGASATSRSWRPVLVSLLQSPAWAELVAYLNHVGATGALRHRWIVAGTTDDGLPFARVRRFGLRSLARNSGCSELAAYFPWLKLPEGFVFPGRCAMGQGTAQLCWDLLAEVDSPVAVTEGSAPRSGAQVPPGLGVEVDPDTRLLRVTARATPADHLSLDEAQALKSLHKPLPSALAKMAKTQTHTWTGICVTGLPEALSTAQAWQKEAAAPDALRAALQAELTAQQKKRLTAQHISPLSAADRKVLLQLLQDLLEPTSKAPE